MLSSQTIKQLEDNFLLYGKYNLDSLEKIIRTINHLGERVHRMEELLMGKDHSVATQQFLHASSIGRLLFAHKLSIYLTSIQETQLRLYDELERVLREFLSAVRILSKGYLPAFLLPPTVLCRITSNALQIVQMIKHVTFSCTSDQLPVTQNVQQVTSRLPGCLPKLHDFSRTNFSRAP